VRDRKHSGSGWHEVEAPTEPDGPDSEPAQSAVAPPPVQTAAAPPVQTAAEAGAPVPRRAETPAGQTLKEGDRHEVDAAAVDAAAAAAAAAADADVARERAEADREERIRVPAAELAEAEADRRRAAERAEAAAAADKAQAARAAAGASPAPIPGSDLDSAPLARLPAPEPVAEPVPGPSRSVSSRSVSSRSVSSRPVPTAPPAPVSGRPEGGSPKLGDLLMSHGLIDPHQLAAALLRQTTSGQLLGQVLVDEGVLAESDLLDSLADQLGLKRVDLGRQSPDKEAVRTVPEKIARSYRVVPLRLDGETVEIVTSDPRADLAAALGRAVGRTVRLLVAPADQVQQAIDTSYRTVEAISDLARGYESLQPSRADASTGSLSDLAPDAPVVQVVNLLITQALRDRASDVHIEPQDGQIRVRFRVDGALHEVIELPAGMGPALISRLKIMGGMNIVERRRPQDGQIAMDVDGRSIDIRVATVATVAGEKCVLRILDKSRPLYKLEDLGMPSDTYETFGKLIRAPFGMVICAGPTGSGKTTTLYAALSEIDGPDRNITTVEDPVEYIFPTLNQIQVNEQAGLTFADGLKSILRQDPDVILVGEVRDAETARIAVQSALTGHLVLSSFHATDTASALHRLLDMGIESFLVASAVTAVVAQRLLRRICPSCKVPYTPTEEEMVFYRDGNGHQEAQFWIGTGCNFCSGTGYRDRVGVYELMRLTPELRRLIVGWASQEEIRRTASAQGMRTLHYEGLRLVASGVTTISEVIRGVYAGV